MTIFFDAFDEYTKKEYHEDVQYMKDREEYLFYSRIGDLRSSYNCAFFKSYPHSKQLLIKLKSFLIQYPLLYKTLKKFKCRF